MSRLTIGLGQVGCVLGCVLGCSASVRAPMAPEHAAVRAATPPVAVLPVRSIRFYESGIAQFDRAGQVPAGAATLSLPTSHLDDVLKTLLVRRNGSAVPAFSATFPGVLMERNARALAKLPLDVRQNLGYLELLQSLKGESVEILLGKRHVEGRLVQVAKLESPTSAGGESASSPPSANKPRAKPGVPTPPAAESSSLRPELPEFELTLLTQRATVERFLSRDASWIRPLDPEVSARLEQAIGASSGRAHQMPRIMKILAGAGKDARLSYVTEVPVWRATYRVELEGRAGTASVQGLALLHNDTDEPWTSVQVELSNGEPDSMLSPLAAPRYWERQLRLTPESRADVVAQLTKHSADKLTESGAAAGDRLEYDRDRASSRSGQSKPSAVRSSPAPALPTEKPVSIAAGRSSYDYRVSTLVTLPAHSSSLVPFLNTQVKMERGVWFAERSPLGRSVVRLENGTAVPLPAGMMSIFESERFLGEIDVSQLEPGKRGYFDFGTELGMELKNLPAPAPISKVRGVTWKNDALSLRVSEHVERPLELASSANQDRVAFIAVTTREKPSVQGADRVEPAGDNRTVIASIRVAAHQRLARTLVIDQERVDTRDVDSLEVSELEELLREDWLATASRAALGEALGLLKARTALTTRKERTEQAITKLEESIERLGVNGSDRATPGPIAGRFVQLEAQRGQLKTQFAELEKEIEAKGESLKTALGKLPKE